MSLTISLYIHKVTSWYRGRGSDVGTGGVFYRILASTSARAGTSALTSERLALLGMCFLNGRPTALLLFLMQERF